VKEERVKRVAIAALLFMSSLAALAMTRQQFFIRASAQDLQKRIGIIAQSVQREGAVMHATGDVQVRITHTDGDRTVIHADEVIYHTDTGEIETRGDARITIEKAQ
jgi:lipopolysaccharide assembly outer membrane protein LptD (OstA)